MQTLILFWTKMELLHYPGAGDTRAYLEEELQRQMQMQQMQMQMQQAQMQAQQAAQQQAQIQQQPGLDRQTAQAIMAKAREDAARAAGMR